jgi:hypothetical protein
MRTDGGLGDVSRRIVPGEDPTDRAHNDDDPKKPDRLQLVRDTADAPPG